MGYTSNSKTDTPQRERELEMLVGGFTYDEIAQATGGKRKSIAERNRLIYGVRIQDAFARRIEREGIPSRLNVTDAFGYWFSGFFDGEGHIGAFSRVRPNGYTERRLTIQIIVRHDDADAIYRIRDNFQCGGIFHTKAHGRTQDSIGFRVEKINDLAEVVVPLFEKYPLYSKKAREFLIWRDLVRAQYTVTMRGYSQRAACTDEQNAFFDAGVQAIKKIRHG